jgi:hypothetical protein
MWIKKIKGLIKRKPKIKYLYEVIVREALGEIRVPFETLEEANKFAREYGVPRVEKIKEWW